MRTSIIIPLLLLSIFLSCNGKFNEGNSEDETYVTDSESEENYPDGTYCAEVQYYNSNTGTQSSYTLTVEVANNELTQINFPQGWLNNDNFSAELDDNGNTSFTSDNDCDYEVHIIGNETGCLESVPSAEQCTATTEDGYQCERLTDNSNGLCWQHQDQ